MKKTKAEAKISKVMREYKEGTLHSGKGGPVVKKPKQAIAIALSQSRKKK
jgi:ribosomal protein L21E